MTKEASIPQSVEAVKSEIEVHRLKFFQDNPGDSEWRTGVFNNFLVHLYKKSPARQSRLSDRRKHEKRAAGEGRSHRILTETHEHFYTNVDAAAEKAGVNIDEVLKTRRESGNEGTYAMESVQGTYILLRLLGYSHSDLTG